MARQKPQTDFRVATLDGADELIKTLVTLRKTARFRILRRLMHEGIKPIRDRIQALTPVQSPPFRGQSPKVRLSNIPVKIVARKRSKKWVGVQAQYPTRKRMKIDPTSLHYYPAALEYGQKKGRLAPVPGRFMMKRGLAQTESRAKQIMQKLLQPYLDEEVRRVPKKRIKKP